MKYLLKNAALLLSLGVIVASAVGLMNFRSTATADTSPFCSCPDCRHKQRRYPRYVPSGAPYGHYPTHWQRWDNGQAYPPNYAETISNWWDAVEKIESPEGTLPPPGTSTDAPKVPPTGSGAWQMQMPYENEPREVNQIEALPPPPGYDSDVVIESLPEENTPADQPLHTQLNPPTFHLPIKVPAPPRKEEDSADDWSEDEYLWDDDASTRSEVETFERGPALNKSDVPAEDVNAGEVSKDEADRKEKRPDVIWQFEKPTPQLNPHVDVLPLDAVPEGAGSGNTMPEDALPNEPQPDYQARVRRLPPVPFFPFKPGAQPLRVTSRPSVPGTRRLPPPDALRPRDDSLDYRQPVR